MKFQDMEVKRFLKVFRKKISRIRIKRLLNHNTRFQKTMEQYIQSSKGNLFQPEILYPDTLSIKCNHEIIKILNIHFSLYLSQTLHPIYYGCQHMYLLEQSHISYSSLQYLLPSASLHSYSSSLPLCNPNPKHFFKTNCKPHQLKCSLSLLKISEIFTAHLPLASILSDLVLCMGLNFRLDVIYSDRQIVAVQ